VPSSFSREYYRYRLGLHCHVVPNVVSPERVTATGRQPRYLTVVNPQPEKGLFVVARIVHELARRRPDIPILIVDSRGRGDALEQTGLELSWAKNLFRMANINDPREFYRVSKAVLVPSLCNETFGLVAAEAMTNGIPVAASNRGSLPEIVGDGGLLFGIPTRYTPETRDGPRAEEIEPWVEGIVRLWDDEAFYREQSEKALARSSRWHPDRLRPLYAEFFRNVHHQPAPPILPNYASTPDNLQRHEGAIP
jgi:glycosyltransferase involved in cell wall biosynthesis